MTTVFLVALLRLWLPFADLMWIVQATPSGDSLITEEVLPRISDEQIDTVGERVMQDNEFRSVRRRILEHIEPADADKGFLKKFMEWTGEQIDSVFDAIGSFFRALFGRNAAKNPPATPPPAPAADSDWSFLGFSLTGLYKLMVGLIIVAVLAVAVFLISMVVKSAEKRRSAKLRHAEIGKEHPEHLTTPPGELPANLYEHRALQLAADGNYQAAVRELLLGSMSWIERAGLVKYRRGLTNRDYVRSVWRRREKRDAFAVVALEFERIYFGRRTATEQRFLNCLEHFRGAFREEEQPVAAI
jgi:hypothetical protein